MFKNIKNEIEDLKTQHENELSRQENKFLNEIDKIKSENVNEITSLKHALKLREQEIDAETKKKIDLVEHDLTLARKEFEKDKETMLLKAKKDLLDERQVILEKNHDDIKEQSEKNFNQNVELFRVMTDGVSLSQHNERSISHALPSKIEDVEVKIEE